FGFVYLSTPSKDTDFKPISTIDNCADKVGENFQADVKLPENTSCERCTLRFRWIPKLSEDVYLNCADISILPANKSKLKAQKRCGRGCGGASAKRDLNSNSNFSSRKELKRNLKKHTDFKPISTIDNCADKVGENFQADVKLPENTSCERCTLRFRWIPKLSEDVYLNCADISILPANKSKLKAQKRCGRGCGGASAKRDLNSNSNFSSRKELK
ncbi:19702_t:CDS:2, partial [Entrophospora sp. SA101]